MNQQAIYRDNVGLVHRSLAWSGALLLLLFGLAWIGATPVRAQVEGIQQDEADAIIYMPLSMANIRLSQMPLPRVIDPATPIPSATLEPAEPSATPSPAPTETSVPIPTSELPWWGAYDEAVTDLASIEDLESGYNPSMWYQTLLGVLERRYANGRYIVVELDNSEQQAGFWVGGQTGSFDALLGRLNVTVHEMDHQLGWQVGIVGTQLQSYAFVLREDLTLFTPRMDTYPRSEIAQYLVGPLSNHYRSVYLEGQGSEQGVLSVLDEFNAYTHSLFTGYGIHDQTPPNQRQSHRDGLVTFMMYLQFYLRHARTDHPDDYASMRAEPELREAVKTLWARANFILDLSEDIPSLSLDAEAVEAEVRKQDMQDEVKDFVLP